MYVVSEDQQKQHASKLSDEEAVTRKNGKKSHQLHVTFSPDVTEVCLDESEGDPTPHVVSDICAGKESRMSYDEELVSMRQLQEETDSRATCVESCTLAMFATVFIVVVSVMILIFTFGAQ
jgi:hypothetical protein